MCRLFFFHERNQASAVVSKFIEGAQNIFKVVFGKLMSPLWENLTNNDIKQGIAPETQSSQCLYNINQ